MSVLGGILYGLDSFPTTSNSFTSLYKPTVVEYGSKSDPVTAFMYDPDVPDCIALGFNV